MACCFWHDGLHGLHSDPLPLLAAAGNDSQDYIFLVSFVKATIANGIESSPDGVFADAA